MKLRINETRIRLRLTPGEVAKISNGEKVSCDCPLPQGKFTYHLVPNDQWNINLMSCSFYIHIPENQVFQWDQNEKVGFSHRFENGTELLVEKDFQCLQPRAGENEDHLYPNPHEI